MKISLTLVHKTVATLSIVALVAPVFALPQVAQAATAPFADSFESPANLGNWTVTSGWSANASEKHSGNKSAHVNQTSAGQTLETTISTAGYTNPVFSFWYRTESLDQSQGDKVEVFYSTNGGGNWTEIPGSQIDHNDSQNQWHQFSYNAFPAGANNNANFKIRFQGDLDSGFTSDKVWIDDVSLAGTPLKGTLIVKKEIDGNPTADEDDFSFSVNGGSAITFEADGQNDLTNQNPGQYTITETPAANYTVTYTNCTNITLSAGETETCTIKNTYDEEEEEVHSHKTLVINKEVIGGDAAPNDFTVTVSKHFVGMPWTATSQQYPMDADGSISLPASFLYVYSVEETDSGDYVASYAEGNDDDCDNLFFVLPGTKTCTIKNTYDAPEPTTGSIEITKYVCPEGTTVVRSQNGVGLTVPEGCTPQQGAYFGYVHGEEGSHPNGPHPELDETPTPGGSTDGNGKLTISNLDAMGRYLIVETDANNTKLPHGDILGLYCEGDGDTSDNNDNQEITFVPAGGTAKCVAYNPGEPTPQTCELVSDTTTLVGANPAVLTFVHGNWTTALNEVVNGPKWIWNAAFANPIGPDDEVVTFTKHFSVTGAPTSVMLELAADNYYSVKVNGQAACSDTVNVDNFSAVESCDITSLVTAGVNTMEVTVTNEADHGTNPETNPAGLIYKITVTGASCGNSEPPVPNTLKVHILKYLKVGEDLVAAAGDLPSFPMSASWSASNIGAGAGNYALGPVGHGGAGPYAADTSAMNAPADYSTQEVPNGETVIASDAQCSPGKYRHVGYKTGNTLGEALAAPTTLTVPTFSGLTADKYIIVVNEKCADVSTVTLCKVDGNDTPLSGWNLFLKGEQVQNFNVATNNSAGVNSVSLTGGMSYLATVVGTWTNQGGANPVDAEYSTTDGWATQMDGYTGYGAGILELEIKNTDGNWGPYNSGHQYAQSFIPGVTGPVNFRIFDGDTNTHVQNEGWFGDNGGSLPISLFRGYAGLTNGENGCVTFQNVPFGSYTFGEMPKDGWTYVSGAGEVLVDAAEEVFTIVNRPNTPEVDEVDMCLNIEGTQTSIPVDYYQVDGNCFQDSNGPVQTFSGSTGSGDSGSVLGDATSTPEVLGDVCGLYMDKSLRLGSLKNDSEQTKKLQEFLNKWMSSNLPVSGFFGPLTEAAVKAFQSKYADQILKPWGITAPTGIVYYTTLKQINLLECPELTIEEPELIPWSQNPNAQ